MLARDVKVEACKAYTDNFGVSEKLIQLEAKVRILGKALTEFLKSNDKLISI